MAKCPVCKALNARDEVRKHLNAETMKVFAYKITPLFKWVKNVVEHTLSTDDDKFANTFCVKHQNFSVITEDYLSLHDTFDKVCTLQETTATVQDLRKAFL